MGNKKYVLKINWVFFVLLVWTYFIGNASAQEMDNIILNTEADGTVKAIIKLTGRIEYIRHFPEGQGQHLEIDFKILDSVPTIDPMRGHEIRTSPPSDLIPRFTVGVRNLTTEPKLIVEFSRLAKYSVRIGKDERSIVITIQSDRMQPVEPPKVAAASAVPATMPVVASVLLDHQTSPADIQAEPLMAKGRDALNAKQYGLAIDSFNKVLSFPANKFSQDAQELVGVARENAGQTFKAKVEYETYLKMYTSGPGVERVKDRLAKLSGVKPAQTVGGADAPKTDLSSEKKKYETVSNGSFSMYYYHGTSNTNISGSTIPSTSITDQSMAITSINASMRVRNDQYDNRLVFQDTDSKNFLTAQSSQLNPNRLGAAYYDFKDKLNNISTRIGLQSPTSAAILGRFDGIAAGYGFTPKWQVTAAAGQLYDYASGSQPIFFSAGLGFGTNDRLGGTVYAVNQTVDSVSDRRAVGTEIRYFDAKKNAFGTLDYDTLFHVVNTALIQGTLNGEPGTTYNFLVDHRKTPSMSISNALIGSPSSMNTMLQSGFTPDQLKTLALLRTANANSAQLGVTTQIKEKWQMGADVSVSNTSGTAQSGTNIQGSLDGFVAATPSTGNNYSLNGRLIGNGVFSVHDVSVFSLGYSTSSLMKGESFLFTDHLNLADIVANKAGQIGKMMTDTSLRLYFQNDNMGNKETIISPTVRLNYQVKDKLNLEVDGGIDLTDNTPVSGQSSKTTRKYFTLGFRSDF